MKKSLIFVGMLAIGYANAQEGNVGINTDQPKATLDIQPNATNLAGTTNQGILAPRLSKVRVANIETPVEGTLVYVTDETTSPISAYTGTDTKVAKITEKGYYFYNGTEWVKAGANGELWAQRDNAGVTETYLKPADTDGNTIQYSNKGKTTILGALDESDKWETGNITAYKFNEVPDFKGINSSRFLSTNTMAGGNYMYSMDVYKLLGADANSRAGKIFNGRTISLKINDDVATNLFGSTAFTSNISHQGSGKIDILTSGDFYTFMGTVNNSNEPSAISNTAATFTPRILKGSTDNMRGIWINPRVYGGKVKNLSGITASVLSSELLDGVTTTLPIMNYETIIGSRLDVVNKQNTTTGFLAGTDIYTGIEGNSTAEWATGILSRGKIYTGATVNNYEGIRSHFEAEGAAAVTNFYGFRFYKEINDAFKPVNMYGLWIDNIANGQTSNFSIYTNAGKVRVGDLADTGATTDRVVTVDANGVLKTGSAANIPAVQVGSTTSMTCDDANRGKMNFVKDVDLGGGKTADAFAVCLKGSDGKHYWRYLYGAGGVTNLQGDFGTGLQ